MTINANAPVISRAHLLIDAPARRVWDIHTDVASWPLWQPDVDAASIDVPLAAGASFRWQTAGLDITSTVVAVDPPVRIEWGGPGNGITAVHVWEFEPTGEGLLVRTEESWEGDPIDRAVAQMQAALDASLVTWLQRLKQRAEQQ